MTILLRGYGLALRVQAMLRAAHNTPDHQASMPSSAPPLTLPFQFVRSLVGRMTVLGVYRPEAHYIHMDVQRLA